MVFENDIIWTEKGTVMKSVAFGGKNGDCTVCLKNGVKFLVA